MISKKYTTYVFSFFMSLLMSAIMSMVVSLLNVGLVENIFAIWLRAWGISFVIAFPTIIVISPLVKRLVNLVISK
ncbi:DUF2798 domain-containing protein [Dasania sp. GY-MA-18]|uniref:DUF2798 domain-containing protein n=1 Tax=Dasania phycosphaerae TaxID=2950436 RepID=A0A9J6RMG6_9GAMM|nr:MULTISPECIES: DUF2798 domain-containing protein [Dasania]MCR8923081.1 DUF2798 domain-containing protein [Dasania sp. GY-MA-18]MCZ0865513.1 DUF2798 domain-containing protein [Dasania phycosphaerae]MCZ0869238.1 DUF2798 domain-containing protein [Dasania phycosphaerae]